MVDIQKTITCIWTNQHHSDLKKRNQKSFQDNSGLVNKLITDFNGLKSESKFDQYKKEREAILDGSIDRALSVNEYYMLHYGEVYDQNLRKNEPDMRALADKSSLLKKDRMRMVDWMIEVLSNFAAQGCGTNEHTYFKAVTIMDLCFLKNPDVFTSRNLHIVGVLAMYLASKTLDYMPIDLHYIYKDVVHEEFSRAQLCDYENLMLETLEMDLTVPTWMDFLDKCIFDLFGYYRTGTSLFHLRQQCMYILHIIVMEPTFYNCGGMKLVSAAVIVFTIRRNYAEYECDVNKEIRRKGKNIDDETRKVLLVNKQNEFDLIEDVLRTVTVSKDALCQIVNKIKKTFDQFIKNKQQNSDIGVKHIYSLFKNK